jgi:hypothetical protein
MNTYTSAENPLLAAFRATWDRVTDPLVWLSRQGFWVSHIHQDHIHHAARVLAKLYPLWLERGK